MGVIEAGPIKVQYKRDLRKIRLIVSSSGTVTFLNYGKYRYLQKCPDLGEVSSIVSHNVFLALWDHLFEQSRIDRVFKDPSHHRSKREVDVT
jgi:hypothetical protein